MERRGGREGLGEERRIEDWKRRRKIDQKKRRGEQKRRKSII